MNATDVLVTISIALSGWTLLKVVRLGEDVAVLKAASHRKPEEV